MNKKELTTVLRQFCKELDSRLSELEIEDQRQIGTLICRNRNGKIEFYMKKDGKEVYLKNSDPLIAELAQGMLISKQIEAGRREKEQIKRCIRDLTSNKFISDIDEAYDSLSDLVKPFVNPQKEVSDGYVERWKKQHRKGMNPNRQLDAKYKTMNGEFVRSKSEVLIADRLHVVGVPYLYEAPFYSKTEDKWYYPDFTLLNKRTRTTFIWEHFGMMHNVQYLAESQHKLKMYEQNDYHLGENFLITYEGTDAQLDTEYVDRLIEHFLK